MNVPPRQRRSGPLRGAIAAALTPLSADGTDLDLRCVEAMVALYADAGLSGLMLAGTTGEGILLSVDERCRLTEAFVAAAARRIDVVVHAGAQTTADTVAIARHAARAGAAAVSVIAPPYFPLDASAILEHLATAAAACEPTPFYVYEFADRSGYAVPADVLRELAERCPNFVGLKVSDAPLERFETYLLPWLDVLVGPESLIATGCARGAVGAVSALASAFPGLVAEAVRDGSQASSARLAQLRHELEQWPLHASLKWVLSKRGVPISEAVRAPLRPLTPGERESLAAALGDLTEWEPS